MIMYVFMDEGMQIGSWEDIYVIKQGGSQGVFFLKSPGDIIAS